MLHLFDGSQLHVLFTFRPTLWPDKLGPKQRCHSELLPILRWPIFPHRPGRLKALFCFAVSTTSAVSTCVGWLGGQQPHPDSQDLDTKKQAHSPGGADHVSHQDVLQRGHQCAPSPHSTIVPSDTAPPPSTRPLHSPQQCSLTSSWGPGGG